MFKKSLGIIVTYLFCTTQITAQQATYTSEKSPDANFKQYKTYSFKRPADTSFSKFVNRQKLEQGLATEVKKQLDKRKMVLDTKNPQVLFKYTLVMKHDYKLNSDKEIFYNLEVYSGMVNQPIYYFSSDNRPEVVHGKTEMEQLLDGSLVIDMIDVASNTVIWRSTCKAARNTGDLPSLKETLDIIIPKMFKKCPIK
jgi:hypothetical protein